MCVSHFVSWNRVFVPLIKMINNAKYNAHCYCMKGGSSQQHPQNQNTYTKNKTIFTLFLSGSDDVVTLARKVNVLLVLMTLEIYYL